MLFVHRAIEIMAKVRRRISADIYRGMVLEVTQRLLSEQLIPLAEKANTGEVKEVMVEVLLLAHSNIIIIKRDLMSEN